MKKRKSTKREELILAIATVMKCAYDQNEIGHYEAIGIFESAKYLYLDLKNKDKEMKK